MIELSCRKEFAPCPFCRATDHAPTNGPTILARLPARSPALGPREGSSHDLVLALVHRGGCPRELPEPSAALKSMNAFASEMSVFPGEDSEDDGPASEREKKAFEDYYFSHVPPGEDHVVPRPNGSGRRVTSIPSLLRRDTDAPIRDDGYFVRLTEALHKAIRGADGIAAEATPHELSAALLGIACSVVAAADADFLPPIFLVSFLPELGLSQAATLGLVRTTYAEYHRYEEETLEKERVAISVEEAKREVMDRLREGN